MSCSGLKWAYTVSHRHKSYSHMKKGEKWSREQAELENRVRDKVNKDAQ